MAKFDFDKPVASFSWYLQNGSADDKRGNRLHVGTGQNAQIYFDPESGEFIGKLKYVDDYIDLADGAKQHFELPRTAREYKPSDFSPNFPISNVKFEVDESVKDFLHVLPRGLFFYQNEFYDAVFGDKTDYPESLKDFLFTRTGDIEAAGEFYGAIEKWPQSVYGTLVEKCNVENRPIPEYENDRVLPLDYHKELLASLKDHFGCGESNYRTPDDLLAARSYGSYLSGISLKFNPQDVIAAVEHATAMHFADIGKTFNLKTLARNSSTSISDVEFFRNQGTQKRTSRASAESKTQSARATGKDNIIQFAPRQNGKDIPSSKGTSLASKSQKYVAMANALNAASKSYVYRNEVAR